MANRIVSVHTGIYGMGIYVIMLPSSGFSVAHCAKQFCYKRLNVILNKDLLNYIINTFISFGDKWN